MRSVLGSGDGRWVSRWDPGDYEVHVCRLERTVSSSQFNLLAEISGGSVTVPPRGEGSWAMGGAVGVQEGLAVFCMKFS